MRMSRLSLALLALAAALLIELARQLDQPPPEPAAPPPAAARPLPPPQTLPTPPIERYGEMVARPLFSASRRPVARKQSLAAHSPIRPPEARLVGVLLVDDLRMALLVTDTTKRPRRLAEGQSLDGWTIASIEPRRVLLRQGGLEHELALAKPKAAAAAQARRQPQKR